MGWKSETETVVWLIDIVLYDSKFLYCERIEFWKTRNQLTGRLGIVIGMFCEIQLKVAIISSDNECLGIYRDDVN